MSSTSLLCQIGGLIVFVGGIFLIYKRKIYIDRESRTTTEIELPLGMKLKTNIPSIVFAVVGFSLLFYPTYWSVDTMKKDLKSSQDKVAELEEKLKPVSINGTILPLQKGIKVVLSVKEFPSTDDTGRFAFKLSAACKSPGEMSLRAFTKEGKEYLKNIFSNGNLEDIKFELKE